MEMAYQEIRSFEPAELERLFLSVKWSSGHFPEKLAAAMQNFDTVYSAWDGEKLIGMACVMDDGVMNAYLHYLLVDPDYQGKSVGKTLVNLVKRKYKEYLRLIVIAYEEKLSFYEDCGFRKSEDSSPMFITSLWT